MGLEIDGVSGIIKNTTSDGDITIKGNDGGSEISALVLDMSAAGAATFNNKIIATELDISGAIDVDGTTNLDVVDIDGAVNMATTALVTGVLTTTATAVFNGGFTSNDGVTISTADVNPQLTIISTEAGGDQAPLIDLYRNSSSPADDDILGQIRYYGENSADEKIEYVRIRAGMADVTDGTEDSRYTITTFTGGSQFGRLNIEALETVFNENSTDVDFRVESNDNANMLFVNGGTNRVHFGGSSGDREFNFEGADNLRVLLRSSDNSTGACQLQFGDSDNSQIGRIMYEHDGNKMTFHTEATERLRIVTNLATGAETAPDVASGGLCLQLNANDNAILSFKSSDVDAGASVSGLEADTFALYKKLSANEGGLLTQIQSEIGECYETRALIAEAANETAKNTGANAPIIFKSAENHSGGVRALSNGATNSNVFIISDHTTRRFIFDSEGDLHSDSSNTTFDSYEDAHLVRAFDLSHGRGVINSKFDEFIKYQHEDLANAGLVGREEDGSPNHFINMSGFQRLHNGAIWQQYEKHQRLAEAVYEMAKETLGADKADAILKKHDIKLLN